MHGRIKKLIAIMLVAVLLVGCRADPVNEQTTSQAVIYESNDFNGVACRVTNIQNDVVSIISRYNDMMSEVKEKNPDSYWSDGSYVFFSFEGLNLDLVNHYGWLNERDNFSDIELAIQGSFKDSEGAYVDGIQYLSAEKKSANNYRISYRQGVRYPLIDAGTADIAVNVSYDANHDWASVYKLYARAFYEPCIEGDMFEYARLNKVGDSIPFAVQTANERLYVVYEDSGELRAFYYSRLNDNERAKYCTENGEPVSDVITTNYNTSDSIFNDVNITKDWVSQNPSDVGTLISYENGCLNVEQLNSFTGEIEKYSISQEGKVERSHTKYKEQNVLYITVTEEEIDGAD